MMKKPVLYRYSISENVVAFSTQRQGGVSEGNYASFNVNHYCGDSPEHIAVNKAALCQELGITESLLVYPHQTHQTEIRPIDHSFFSISSEKQQQYLDGVDALTTHLTGVCIAVSTADCIPVLLYDEQHHAVAAIHAGWRGTVARIVAKTVESMTAAYGTQPTHLRAVIGPGISLKNFEVGDEVYETFRQAAFPMESIAKLYQQSKWHLDLPLCNQLQLEDAGVPASHIRQSGICTYDRVGDFFSARRLGINSGRILTGIMLSSL